MTPEEQACYDALASGCDALRAERDALLSEIPRDHNRWATERLGLLAELDALRALLREALNAWTGEGPPIDLDRIRAALGSQP